MLPSQYLGSAQHRGICSCPGATQQGFGWHWFPVLELLSTRASVLQGPASLHTPLGLGSRPVSNSMRLSAKDVITKGYCERSLSGTGSYVGGAPTTGAVAEETSGLWQDLRDIELIHAHCCVCSVCSCDVVLLHCFSWVCESAQVEWLRVLHMVSRFLSHQLQDIRSSTNCACNEWTTDMVNNL